MCEDTGCKEVTEGYDLVVVECQQCAGHLGVDASYLDQVGKVVLNCPYCENLLTIQESDN